MVGGTAARLPRDDEHSGMAVMGRFQRWYLVGGLTVCAVYLLLPAVDAADLLYTAIAVSLPVIGAIALHRDRPSPRRGWAVLTIGFGVNALAEVLCLLLITWEGWSGGAGLVNACFVAGYLVQLAGLLIIIQSRTTGRSRSSWLDAIAVGIATFTIIWTTLYENVVGDTGSRLEWLNQVAEPVLGVALIAMSARLVLGERRGYAVWGLLAAGYVLQAATDATANALGTYEHGGLVDTSWAVAYVLFGAALLHPGRLLPAAQAPTALARREVAEALWLQGAVVTSVVVAIVVRAVPLVPSSVLAVWAFAGGSLLVVNRLRVHFLLRLVSDASATENQRRLKALVDNSHEVIALADPDGVLRYVSSSVEAVTGLSAQHWTGLTFEEVLDHHLPGMGELRHVARRLQPGDSSTWEGELDRDDAGPRTIRVTVVNHIDTPEVAGWVITARDVTDEARLTAELRHQALHDTLTGLPNRALLFDRISHALERASRNPSDHLAVALVDLDEFKSVNDSLGHDTGDMLLQAVGMRLQQAVRPGDTVARLGGDEFGMLLEATSETEAVAIAQRALESLAEPLRLGDVDFVANASIGVVWHRGSVEPLELLRFADIAMYEAKREGKARVKLFREHMHHTARNQLALRLSLAAALDHHEFSLRYQPIIDTTRYRICGVEALLRWTHPTQGPIPPSEFIPVAEQSGLLAPIGEWVLRRACADAAAWPDLLGDRYLSVNVSAAQISDRGFVSKVRRALHDAGFPAHRLLLEVTETMLVDDDALAGEVLSQLRSMGVRVAIDDFGTGYSSLAYLRQLAVDVVKIDQSFIRDLDTDTERQALTRTMLALADGLSMTAIAEGVETEDELAMLQHLGCQFAQGYLFSHPVSAEAISVLMGPNAPSMLPLAAHT